MGRHNAAVEPPPPKDKPSYRFPVAIGGILLLAFLSMAVVAAMFPESGPQAAATTPPDPPSEGSPFPQLPGEPTITGGPIPSSTSGQGSTPAPGRGPSAPATSAPPANPNGAAPPVGEVSGAFQLTQDYDGGFIGSVQLTNATAAEQAWQIKVVFGANVGALQAHWIGGGPGDFTIAQAGQAYTFTGQQPVAAGTKIGVYFQFGKTAGDAHPSECLVNGKACSG